MKITMGIILSFLISGSAFSASVQNNEIGTAKIIERIFYADYEACAKNFKDFICSVTQYESNEADLGIKLEAKHARCKYEVGRSKFSVIVESMRTGYMAIISNEEGPSIRGAGALRYIKQCFSTLKDDAIKIVVLSNPK